MIQNIKNATADLSAALDLRRVWIALAVADIGDNYGRTKIGPVWVLINYLIYVWAFVVVFGHAQNIPQYVPHVAIGFMVWLFISQTITLSVNLFSREEALIKGTVLPISVYVFRLTMQTAIRTAYTMIGCLAIVFWFTPGIDIVWIWSLAGMLLICITAPPAIICFGIFGTLFPDLQHIVSNTMRIGLFLTPVFWMNQGSGGMREILYVWNPFTYFLEAVRQPITAGEVPIEALLLSGGMSLALWAVALVLLGSYRKQIVYMV